MTRLLLLTLLLAACDDGSLGDMRPDATAPPTDAAPPPTDAGPPLTDAWPARPTTQVCKPAPVDFDRLPPVDARRAVPEVAAADPAQILADPSGRAWWIAERSGVIRSVPVGPGAGLPATVLDRRGLVGELRGFALPPVPAPDTLIYVSATQAGRLKVTRYTVWANTGQADPGSAEIVFEAPDLGGGELHFARDGRLLMVLPDGVRVLAPEPEVAAWGPGVAGRGCHYDDAEGALWCVDAERVLRSTGAAFETVAEPGCAPVGGVVYRGLLYPELWGTYVYACGAQLRGLRATGAGWLDGPIAELDQAPLAFAVDTIGRAHAATAEGLLRVEVTEPDAALGLPRLLSETGCFTALAPLQPTAELVPYRLNSPLWTDDAHKRRWVVLPPGEVIEAPDEDEWSLPVGAMLIKDFAFPTVDGALRSVETRFMVRWPFGFSFHSYRWNAEGTDAELLDGLEAEYADLQVPDAEGTPHPLHYLFPSRQDCQTCHNPRVARVLGPSTAQLARSIPWGAGEIDQLDALFAHGVLDRRPAAAALPDPTDPTAGLEPRARAYLHGNCAHCHRPGGWAPPDLGLDLRFDTPLAEAGLCDVPLTYSAFGVPGTQRVAAGDPADSNLLQRMLTRGFGQMPLLGSAVVDPVVEPLFTAWIRQLQCD